MWVLPGIYYICKCSGGGKQTPDYISPSLTSRIIVWDSVLVRSGNYGHCCILPFTGLELLRNFYAEIHVSSQELLNMASDWMAAHPQPIRSHVAAPKFRKVRSSALQSNTWPLMLIHKNEICFRAIVPKPRYQLRSMFGLLSSTLKDFMYLPHVRLKQNGHHFADDNFMRIFLKVIISIENFTEVCSHGSN